MVRGLSETMRAVLAAEQRDDRSPSGVASVRTADLPDGELTLRVRWSSLNYKDGLAVTGKGKVVRSFPMVCGVDLVGEVIKSVSPDFEVGDEVIVTGFGLGEEHWGGYADFARVRAEWAVPLPAQLTARRSMAIGTAGLTAMLCVMALEERGVAPAVPTGSGSTAGSTEGPVLVTGAAGGVGSVAVAVLAQLGYEVHASSGRPEQAGYLRRLGASEVIDRAELAAPAAKVLERETWAGAVDAVGGATLASAIRRTRYGGTVTACGLTGGVQLDLTVHPFILRGVSLVGVESVRCPLPRRREAWHRLATDLPVEMLDDMTSVAPLEDVPRLADEIVGGRTRGRVVIEVGG